MLVLLISLLVFEKQNEAAATTEAVAIVEEPQGFDIQMGFKVFCQLLLQLDFDFNIQALKALITPEAVDVTITKAEGEVTASQEGAKIKGVADKEEAAQGATTVKVSGAVNLKVGVVKVEATPQGEEAH